MTYLNALILGIVQGLTEFLPVSSSGHLVLAQHLLGMRQPELFFDVMLHLATLAAVLVYFRADLYLFLKHLFRSGKQGGADWMSGQGDAAAYLLRLLIATVPAAVAGLLLNDFIESMFASPLVVCADLAVTGTILLAASFAAHGSKSEIHLPLWKIFLIGIAQAVALAPGISRSGSTIAMGLILGLRPTDAARFSFFLAIPAISGAAVLEIAKEINNLNLTLSALAPVIAGMIVAMLSGIAALYLLINALRRGHLVVFAVYCWLVAVAGFVALRILY